jgi:hypothetical protein
MPPRTNASTELRNSGLVERLFNLVLHKFRRCFLWLEIRLCVADGRVYSRGVSSGVFTQALQM